MLSLRAAAARTRATTAVPASFSPSARRLVGTHEDHSKSDGEKRPIPPHSPSLPINHAPGWNEALATPSEAVVKADRETTTINEMQQQTVDHQSAHHRASDPEVVPTHATYARDEVGGPLSNAGVGEFEGVVGKDDLGPDEVQVESNGRVVTRRTTIIREKSSVGQTSV